VVAVGMAANLDAGVVDPAPVHVHPSFEDAPRTLGARLIGGGRGGMVVNTTQILEGWLALGPTCCFILVV